MANDAPRPANESRGELEIVLGTETFVLRPSFEAIEAFERGTGRGLMALTGDALSGSLSLSDTATIVCECIRAHGRATNVVSLAGSKKDRIAELIIESEGGFQMVLVVVAGMLSLAVTGGTTGAGELKAATMTTTSEPPAAA